MTDPYPFPSIETVTTVRCVRQLRPAGNGLPAWFCGTELVYQGTAEQARHLAIELRWLITGTSAFCPEHRNQRQETAA